MQCPKCSRAMHNCGNISGRMFYSYPPQWDEVHVCHSCRVKTTVRVRGTTGPDLSFLSDYTELGPEPTKEPT